jgi:hypothetical protein
MGVKAYTAEEIAQGAKTGRWTTVNNRNGAAFASNSGASTESTRGPASSVSLQSVLPSQRMVSMSLGPMQIGRPENWPVIMPQHNADYVTIAPQAGVTPNGVGYGVLINAGKTNGQQINLDDITMELVQQLQRTHGVRPVGESELIDLNGVQGRSVMMQSISPFPSSDGQQQLERDWLVTVPQSNDLVIYFVFVAPQSEFGRFQPTYQAMLKSLKF